MQAISKWLTDVCVTERTWSYFRLEVNELNKKPAWRYFETVCSGTFVRLLCFPRRVSSVVLARRCIEERQAYSMDILKAPWERGRMDSWIFQNKKHTLHEIQQRNLLVQPKPENERIHDWPYHLWRSSSDHAHRQQTPKSTSWRTSFPVIALGSQTCFFQTLAPADSEALAAGLAKRASSSESTCMRGVCSASGFDILWQPKTSLSGIV